MGTWINQPVNQLIWGLVFLIDWSSDWPIDVSIQLTSRKPDSWAGENWNLANNEYV